MKTACSEHPIYIIHTPYFKYVPIGKSVSSVMFKPERTKVIKTLLVSCALIIAAGSLFVSNALIADLKSEEQARVGVWAEAMQSFMRADENTDLNLVLRIINGNHTIPVILLDEQNHVIDYRNITFSASTDTTAYLASEARAMREGGHSMQLSIDNMPGHFTLCYGESTMLKRLAVYPYIQLAVVGLFFILAVSILLSSKKSEQNKVWVGLSRETAHQLGTPISSLMAWTEVLQELYPEDDTIEYLKQDVERLQLIADRFSKIGSAPKLAPTNVSDAISSAIKYMAKRTSGKAKISYHPPQETMTANLCPPLFAWVIENLCKNAVDAMSGVGSINITAWSFEKHIEIDVTDTGKGIPASRFKSVFRPGYTTKQRGWGLGLSLAKRIIEQYHKGKIFVKQSEINVGTTFTIILPKHHPKPPAK